MLLIILVHSYIHALRCHTEDFLRVTQEFSWQRPRSDQFPNDITYTYISAYTDQQLNTPFLSDTLSFTAFIPH
jgi:hypothetical protein